MKLLFLMSDVSQGLLLLFFEVEVCITRLFTLLISFAQMPQQHNMKKLISQILRFSLSTLLFLYIMDNSYKMIDLFFVVTF